MPINKKLLYICELKVDDKIVERRQTDDYEVWYDKIADKVYGINFFRKIEIKIKANDR